MKVFQIGFNKCGTTSIAKYYQSCGLKVAHYENGKIAKVIDQNIKFDQYILRGISEFDVYTDMVFIDGKNHIEAFKEYEKLKIQVPNAKFILNVRNVDNWVDSCLRHPRFAERMKSVYGYRTNSEVRAHWLRDWETHIDKVKLYFSHEDLLVFDIENNSPSLLADFVGVQPPKSPHAWRQYNRSISKTHKFLGDNTPTILKNIMPEKLKKGLRFALRIRR